MELPAGHRFLVRVAATLGFGSLGGEDFEEELFIEPCELAIGGDGKQLVGEIDRSTR